MNVSWNPIFGKSSIPGWKFASCASALASELPFVLPIVGQIRSHSDAGLALRAGNGKSRRSGFTLLELLAVVAITVVLITIGFPVFKNSLASSRNVTCLSHLRDLGRAFQLYANDHNGEMPIGWGAVNDNWMVSLVAPVNYLEAKNAYLTPLRDNLKSVMYCPKNVSSLASPSTSGAVTSYGYNHYGLSERRIQSVPHPSKTCVLGEVSSNLERTDWPNLAAFANGATVNLSAKIHKAFSNVLYLDWHVEAINGVPPASDKDFWGSGE